MVRSSAMSSMSSHLSNLFRFSVSVSLSSSCTGFHDVLVGSMGSVNLVVIVESVQSLITSDGDLKDFHIPSIVAVAAALGGCSSIFMTPSTTNPA